jgi:hypothetical protein
MGDPILYGTESGIEYSKQPAAIEPNRGGRVHTQAPTSPVFRLQSVDEGVHPKAVGLTRKV